jgi:hypothetical protein
MSFEESFRLDVCHQVLRGKIGAKEAALKIGKSYRQTLRIIEKVRTNGQEYSERKCVPLGSLYPGSQQTIQRYAVRSHVV